jgi:hypothetical protein
MKKIKIVFIKPEKIIHGTPVVVKLAEQIYYSDSDNIMIVPPAGYYILQVTEILPDILQSANKKFQNGKCINTN